MLDQTNEQLAQPGENIEGKLTLKQVISRAKELGKREGLGDNSRPGMFLLCVDAAKRRAIAKADVPVIFEDYSKSSAAARGVGWKKQDSEKQQVSKLTVAVRLGELPHVDGMALMEKVIAYQKAQRIANDGKMDYSPFDGMVRVARHQIGVPSVMLNDDVVQGLLLKPAKELAAEADRLAKVTSQIDSLLNAKEEPMSDESVTALAKARKTVRDRIDELGGTTADIKRRDKEKADLTELVIRGAEANAALAAKGISVETLTYNTAQNASQDSAE